MIARRVHPSALVAALLVASPVGFAGCGAAQGPRPTDGRTLALAVTSSLPATMGPVRWTLFVDRRRVWAGEASSEPVAVEVGIANDARTVQLAGEADGTPLCATSFVHVELSRSLSSEAREARLDVELATDANGVVHLRSDHRGMTHTEDLDSRPGAAPPAGASDDELADFMADLLIAARRSGDLTAVACVRRRVDETMSLLAGRRARSHAGSPIGLDADVTVESPSQNARLRALASAAAQCPLHGQSPSVRYTDSVEVAGPPRCGVRPPEARVSVDVEEDDGTRVGQQRYPGSLPDIPRSSGDDTIEVTVERVAP